MKGSVILLLITFEDVIVNTILVIFPLLIYLVINCYYVDMNKYLKKQLLYISLITSLYLCFRFGIDTSSSIILLFCNIPIVIAYMKKESVLGLVLSGINIIYSYFMFKSIFIFLLIKYICYYTLYLFARKKKLSTGSFIVSIAVIQGFFLSFEYFYHVPEVEVSDLLSIMILIFIHYFITFSVIYIFKVIEKVESLNNIVEVLEKEKSIKDALFKLTHEIKNPLAVCKGYLDMINLEDKEKSEKYISIIKNEIERSLNIMTDFLAFNKIKIKKEEIDLNLLLEEIYESFSIITSKKNIDLIYKQSDDEIYIEADYDRLKQVIINLIKNSIEAIEDKGKIIISCIEEIDYVNITVEDSGKGMTSDELESIGNMFYSTKKHGSGLGVSLSNEIIKAHNGTLKYDSTLNKGTTATIRLPIE